jgi:predicted dehydrogenase/threonine dehydrogenase-like Zn-dependent dehydrogenase
MKQVIENMKTGKVEVVEVPVPRCGPKDLLVRSVSSLISVGTEKLMIETGRKSFVGKALARPDLVALALHKAKREGFLSVFRQAMSRLDEPVPLGYSCAGVVQEVGSKVKGFAVGDSVACAGAGFAGHAEVVKVPHDLCVKLPKAGRNLRALSYDEAAFVMLGGIALHGFRTAKLSFGETVVVVGLGLIGLLTVQIAKAYGCRVFGVDIDEQRVKLARQLGCDLAMTIDSDRVESAILNATHGEGADAVILAAATKDNSPIQLSERIARRRAVIVLVGVSEITLTRKTFWEKELVFTVSRAGGPGSERRGEVFSVPLDAVRWTESRNLEEFIRLLATDRVNVAQLITHRYPIQDALAAYEMILKGREHYLGVLLTYPQRHTFETVVRLDGKTARPVTDRSFPRRTIGFIGAGLFARSVLLPAVRKVGSVDFGGVATSSGISAQHVGKRFGFSYATSDYKKILLDKNIGSVIVTTRHHLHASLILEALEAGKHVFVEKPLCITREELSRLVETVPAFLSKQMFMIGFNRRYSSLSARLKSFLDGRTVPLQAYVRVNAGFISPDHWTNNPEIGGGRIIGEVCHFIDYLQFLTGADPVEVQATSIHGDTGRFLQEDNVVLTIRFSDGSLGTIMYTAMGPMTYSREYIEVFCDGQVGVLEDFRKLKLVRGTRRRSKRLWSQDKGFKQEVETFLNANPEQGREIFRQAVLTTQATFAAVESLRTRKPVSVVGR